MSIRKAVNILFFMAGDSITNIVSKVKAKLEGNYIGYCICCVACVTNAMNSTNTKNTTNAKNAINATNPINATNAINAFGPLSF
ncbi:MAG: hypothetical protein ABH843_05065 [Candidatus Omnitrophota bacterium]